MIEEITKEPIKHFVCHTCGWLGKINYTEDEQALNEAVECPKCKGIAKVRKPDLNTLDNEQPAIDM